MLSTSQKIRIARALSATVLTVRNLFDFPSDVIVTRRGLTWSLNLKEGIDLAIYVLGGFELRTLRRYTQLIKGGDVVLDIGANIGAHTLPLAKLVGDTGKVYSFEPTAYAFAKQKINIALNPSLITRISAHQMMLMGTNATLLPKSVYSSWPLEVANDLHSEHHGRLMQTNGSLVGTLDDFVHNSNIKQIDFIKIDVDGNENEVLSGAKSVLKILKPKIMVELAPYVYRSNPEKFDELLDNLWNMGYTISDMATGRQLPRNSAAIRAIIPEAGALNALATSEIHIAHK